MKKDEQELTILATVLDRFESDDGSNLTMIEVGPAGNDTYFLILDCKGNVLDNQPTLEFIQNSWYDLTGKSFDSHGLKDGLADQLRAQFTCALQYDVSGYSLNYLADKLVGIVSEYLKPKTEPPKNSTSGRIIILS